MKLQSRVKGGRGTRAKLLTSGVASISISQRMSLSRRKIASGSIAGDWQAVEGDVRSAVRDVKRELETA